MPARLKSDVNATLNLTVMVRSSGPEKEKRAMNQEQKQFESHPLRHRVLLCLQFSDR